ncbi:MAG: ATP-binding cassette domain-containing protein, partial [bacterium]|nr:ATP-binding cassette domain-containing protein [bacterium]
ISFKVMPGEHWAVIGASGIGKSTLISIIMRFYKPQDGRYKEYQLQEPLLGTLIF